MTGGAAAGEMFLGANERAALWLAAPADDKLPKDAKEGAPRAFVLLLL